MNDSNILITNQLMGRERITDFSNTPITNRRILRKPNHNEFLHKTKSQSVISNLQICNQLQSACTNGMAAFCWSGVNDTHLKSTATSAVLFQIARHHVVADAESAVALFHSQM